MIIDHITQLTQIAANIVERFFHAENSTGKTHGT
jgi:hypothetical protein